jgi:hypothetical protein
MNLIIWFECYLIFCVCAGFTSLKCSTTQHTALYSRPCSWQSLEHACSIYHSKFTYHKWQQHFDRSLDSRAVPWPWEEGHGQNWAWARHGKCESVAAALCKSNGKETFWTFSGTAWQGNGMGTAWTRHAKCESALKSVRTLHTRYDIQPLNNSTKTVNSETRDLSVKTSCLCKLKSSFWRDNVFGLGVLMEKKGVRYCPAVRESVTDRSGARA